MKKALYLIAVLMAFGCKSNSQKTADKPIDLTQVTWEANVNEALAEAGNRDKLLFVECYSPTCPYCQALEPYFKKPEVAKKYNENFVNFKLDVGVAEQVKFLNDRGIWLPSFPMFLYFDKTGKLVHQSSVDPTVESVNNAASIALDPSKNASSYKARFEKGEKSMSFLADYANWARVIKDTTANLAAAAKLFEIYPKDQIGSEESWKLTKKAVTDIDNGFAKHWLMHSKEAGAFEAKDGHAGNEGSILQGILQSSLYSVRAQQYDIPKLNLIKQYMRSTGAGQYADGATWELEVKANIRSGNTKDALAIGEKMVNTYKTNSSALVYITRVFIDNFKDNSFIPTAKKWMATALPGINQDNVKAEYHYELARLNQKAGETADARSNAAMALNLAQKTGGKLEKFQALVNSF